MYLLHSDSFSEKGPVIGYTERESSNQRTQPTRETRAADARRSVKFPMKITILLATCILAGAAIFIARKQPPITQSTAFPMHSSEKDGRISAVIPIGKGKNLYVFGEKDGANFTFTSLAYSLDGKVVFSHTDTKKDGILDELEFREPPFADMRLYTLDQDGSYSKSSLQTYNEVMKTQKIYKEAAEEAFSPTTVGSDEFNKVYEKAHSKVRDLKEKK